MGGLHGNGESEEKIVKHVNSDRNVDLTNMWGYTVL